MASSPSTLNPQCGTVRVLGHPRGVPLRLLSPPQPSLLSAERCVFMGSHKGCPYNRLLAFHRLEELIVGLGIFQPIQQELDSRQIIHGMENLTEDPHLLQLLWFGDQLLAACSRT